MMDIREHKLVTVRESNLLISGSRMALTDELVSLSLRPAVDVGPEPHRTPLTEAEVEMLANRLLDESTGAPLWIFAYGSLIWKPDFDAVESQHGATRGWHRSFCLQMTRWRGTRAQPGLMMALDRGGRCNGIVFRLADDDRLGQIRRLIRREVGTIEDAATVRWIPVATARARARWSFGLARRVSAFPANCRWRRWRRCLREPADTWAPAPNICI